MCVRAIPTPTTEPSYNKMGRGDLADKLITPRPQSRPERTVCPPGTTAFLFYRRPPTERKRFCHDNHILASRPGSRHSTHPDKFSPGGIPLPAFIAATGSGTSGGSHGPLSHAPHRNH